MQTVGEDVGSKKNGSQREQETVSTIEELVGRRWVEGSCWGVLARIPPGNRKDARLALMREV